MVDLATTNRQYLRVDEVVEIFGVCRRTVYNWIEQKRIPAVAIGGGPWVIPVADLRKRADPGYAGAERRRSNSVQPTQSVHDSL